MGKWKNDTNDLLPMMAPKFVKFFQKNFIYPPIAFLKFSLQVIPLNFFKKIIIFYWLLYFYEYNIRCKEEREIKLSDLQKIIKK